MKYSPTMDEKQPIFSNDEDRTRFQMELEFVQALANPEYLLYLAQNTQCFSDERFINYLNYLQYWKTPEYRKFIIFPHCLYFLEMLQHEKFRQWLVHKEYVNLLHEQQFHQWKFGPKLTDTRDSGTHPQT